MTWLQDFFAIINGIFSPPNWGNPCLRERTSRRSGWILFVSVKKNDPEKGVILLMATRNPARKPVDVAHMIYVNIPLFKGFLHPRWLAGFLPSTVSQKVGPWDYHFVSFGVWGGWIWVRIFWDSSVSSSKGNIAVSNLNCLSQLAFRKKTADHFFHLLGETHWNEDHYFIHMGSTGEGWGSTIMIPSSNCRSTFADLIW